MITKIEHLGIAVADLAQAKAVFDTLLARQPYKTEVVEREGVTTVFYGVGESKIELLQATQPDSAIAKYIDKRGEGIHHVAFAVDDIRAEMARLNAQGYTLLSSEPLTGADNKLICFLHPKQTGGVLIELCQDR